MVNGSMVSFLIQLLVQPWLDLSRYFFSSLQAGTEPNTKEQSHFGFSYLGTKSLKQTNTIFIIEAASLPNEIFKKRSKNELLKMFNPVQWSFR